MELMYLLLIAEFAFLVLMGAALWAVLKAMRRRAGAGSGGWAAAEATWSVPDRPREPIATGESLLVGRVLWRNCVDVGADLRGLHLAVRVPILGGFGKTPLRIPWDAFHAPEPAKLFWGEARLWHLGDPEVTTITLGAELEAKIRARGFPLGARAANGGARDAAN